MGFRRAGLFERSTGRLPLMTGFYDHRPSGYIAGLQTVCAISSAWNLRVPRTGRAHPRARPADSIPESRPDNVTRPLLLVGVTHATRSETRSRFGENNAPYRRAHAAYLRGHASHPRVGLCTWNLIFRAADCSLPRE